VEIQTTISVGTDGIYDVCYFIASSGKYSPELQFLIENSWIVLSTSHLVQQYIVTGCSKLEDMEPEKPV
jgi:hypothetical protein